MLRLKAGATADAAAAVETGMAASVIQWLPKSKGRKAFFFEKKKQKTFIRLAADYPDGCGPRW
jgi:hypothetical protein